MTAPTITVTIDGAQVVLPGRTATVDVWPDTRDEFITTIRGLLTVPGAESPTTGIGVAATVVTPGVTFRVYAPRELREPLLLPVSPVFEAAVADAVNAEAVA